MQELIQKFRISTMLTDGSKILNPNIKLTGATTNAPIFFPWEVKYFISSLGASLDFFF
jgi:hypothetical protein